MAFVALFARLKKLIIDEITAIVTFVVGSIITLLSNKYAASEITLVIP